MRQTIQRAVEIAGTGRHLRKERGFLVVCHDGAEVGRVPLDDLEVVLYTGHGMTCSAELLIALAELCVPFIVCDHSFMPSAVLWPMESHHLQSGRIRAQAGLTRPAQKRLWQQLVRAKISMQALVLQICTGESSARLERLAATVKPGDTTNAEGEAARVYWQLLFGPDFRRQRSGKGVNELLNYGYTVLRAGVARAVMLAGLHPAFGVFHRSQRDTMPLVDDLMEPYRPLVDMMVHAMAMGTREDLVLTPEAKTWLTTVTMIDMVSQREKCPAAECLLRMTRSLSDVCEGRRKQLVLPEGLADHEAG